ncbi:MAG TPA: GNAT family N-acetyltransferase [Candidatus Saccharimonadales bacterium]
MATPGKILVIRNGGSIYGTAARESDAQTIEDLIITDGQNEWNYLPEAEILRKYLASIANGSVFGIKALAKPIQSVVGAVTYDIGHRYPQYQPLGREDAVHGYLSEAVVRPDYAGHGLGTALLSAAITDLGEMGIQEVYAMRHADNDPSRRMMEKSGMVLVDEFPDPEIRPTGSGRTAVMCFLVENQ